MTYTQAYENSLHFSPRFQSYAESLARRLIQQYDLHDKDMIEIGCGQGDFLRLLCQLGGNRGVGFDPSYVPEQDEQVSKEQIMVIQDFYSERYADYKADFLYSRHVLEHIQFPRSFLSSVRRSIGSHLQTVLFFEVPNVMFTLQDLGIWDLIYEHCSYFSRSSLAHLFMAHGFQVYSLIDAYEGQFLCIEALPREESAHPTNEFGNDLEEITSLVTTFAGNYRAKVELWQQNLERLWAAGQRAVVWGGGSKGITFLNMLKIRDQIAHVVDINPRKQGNYVAGTGQQIIPPESLREYQPDVVIVMNPVYEREILQLTESLGLTPELMYA
jgi:SAM-dependent methyltransferase